MTPSVPESRLAGFYFMYFALIGAFMPYWNLYLEQQGLDKSQIGWLASITVITRILAPSVWGYLADRTGLRMRWVRIGTWAQCVAWLAIFWIPKEFQAIAIVLFIFSFFQHAILAQFEAVTLFWLGDQRERYGQIRLWGSIGFIVAVAGLGWIFDWVSVNTLPLWMIALAGLTLLMALAIAEPPVTPTPKQQQQPIWQVLWRPQVRTFFALEFLLLLSHAPFYSFYSNYLAEHGYSTSTIGVLWGIGVLAEVIMFTQSQKILTRYPNTQLLIALCLGATALRWVLVAAFPNILTIQVLAQCIHALSFALFQSVAMRLIFENFATEQQGRGQATFSMVWGIGVALGSMVAGQYWDSWSGSVVFLLAALIVGVATIWAVIAWPKVPKPS
jgi:PPP family 3-phenylpropionic acid transporter